MAIFRVTGAWVLIILAGISLSCVNVNAQVPAPAPATSTATADCMTLIYNMSDCLTYVQQGSNSTKPDKDCCPELAGMLDANPICLCQLLGKNNDLGLQLDLNRALKLPSICRLKTPSISLCSVVGMPVGVPGAAPTSSEGPSSSGMSPEAGAGVAPSPGKNGASTNAYTNLPCLLGGLAFTFTSLLAL